MIDHMNNKLWVSIRLIGKVYGNFYDGTRFESHLNWTLSLISTHTQEKSEITHVRFIVIAMQNGR